MKTNSTLNIVFLSFLLIAVLFTSYIVGSPGEKKDLEREALREYLSRPVLQLPVIQATSQTTFSYLQKNNIFPKPSVTAASIIIKDIKSGAEFFSLNTDERRPIASITKLFTAALVIENADLEEKVKVSFAAVENEGNAGNFRPDEIVTVKVLLNAALLESSNDAAFALAEYVGGKNTEALGRKAVSTFVELMNNKASELGLTNSYFTDPTGLEDVKSYSTARDLALFIKYLREEARYLPLWDILQQESANFQALNVPFEHNLQNNNPFVSEFPSTIGGKTGYTDRAGESMVLVVKSPDGESELIYIVLGSTDRFADIKNLINWVNNAFIWEK